MASSRVVFTTKEELYYARLFDVAGPDISGHVAGRTGAQFLSTSGLPRDVLHKIWTIADNLQQGKLDKDSFMIACRLVSHCQSGMSPDVSLIQREPQLLPVFEGIRKPTGISATNLAQTKEWDVISISDIGNDNLNTVADATRAVDIAINLNKLGLDPLEFVPFQSGPSLPKTSSIDWSLPELDHQKYLRLYETLAKNAQGNVDGSVARKLLERSRLNKHLLGSIWELADSDRDGSLNKTEFVNCMHLTTCCKRGAVLPNSLPVELSSPIDPVDAGKRQTEFVNFQHGQYAGRKPEAASAWKYSRTYLGGDEIDETEEEIRHMHEITGQVESDISRMNIELDKRRLLINELETERRTLTEKKTQVVDSRRKLNFDKLSLQRDRAKLQSEILHLQKLVKDGYQDNSLLKQSIAENEKEIEKIMVQVATLGSQRREAVRQHNEELDKIEGEQRETSGLVESFNRTNREVDVKLESERILREKQRIIDEMQSRPGDIPQSLSALSNEKSNKWATRILSESASVSGGAKNVGFGSAFFNSQ